MKLPTYFVQTNDYCQIETVIYEYLNHLTVCQKMIPDSFKNVFNKMCLQIIYLIYLYEQR